jgi:hypothetical protein
VHPDLRTGLGWNEHTTNARLDKTLLGGLAPLMVIFQRPGEEGGGFGIGFPGGEGVFEAGEVAEEGDEGFAVGAGKADRRAWLRSSIPPPRVPSTESGAR